MKCSERRCVKKFLFESLIFEVMVDTWVDVYSVNGWEWKNHRMVGLMRD